MCEQSSLNYNSGDVVWVKLGPCWWPGEIISLEDLPADITESFKKPPLHVVKFFDEEKYEFVRQLSHISSYNSNKKYDYIRKGLDLYRAKHAFMEKFRGDVITAEKKTDGDPNILSDSRLEPEKRPNYASIFGSPMPKKPKDSPARGRGRTSTAKSQSSPGSAKKMSCLITHPRFLRKDDSEVRILVQTPREIRLPEREYECSSCGFKCSRIEVIVFHNKSHSHGGSSSQGSSKKKKAPVKRTKKRRLPFSKTTTIDEDLELLRQGLPLCSEESSEEESDFSTSSSSSSSTSSSDEEPLIKRKAKAKTPVKTKKPKPPPPPPSPPEVKKQTDICTDLLAEWDDDDEDEEENQPIAERLSPKATTQPPEEISKDSPKIDEKEKEKSCFDFEEDEEALLTTIEGRKIPRVIPPTDRRKSIQEDEKSALGDKSRSATPKSIEDNVIEPETDKPKEDKKTELENDESESVERKRESQFQLEFEAFNNALKDTALPEILDIQSVHKSEQNFHNAKTIKFPDKSEGESSTSKEPSPPPPDLEVPTKSEECKPIEPKQAEPVTEPPQAEPVTETPQAEPVTEPPPAEPVKEPVVKNTEVATKLTNPKKRFVKTFEDETKNSTKEPTAAKEKKDERVIEEAKHELKSLEVSKLKTQLMKKLGDATSKKEILEKSRRTVCNRSRRSKTFVEVKKIQPAENKDKRRIAETASDNETRAQAKKKKYTSDYFDDNNKTQDTKVDVKTKDVQKKFSAKETKKTLKDPPKEHQSIEAKSTSHLDYLNTSPSKIFSELHVDKDELLDATSLSESQMRTIQSIIGVASSMASIQPSKSQPEVEKVQETSIQSETTKEVPDTIKKPTEEVESKTKKNNSGKKSDQSMQNQEEIEKAVTETSNEPIKDAVEGKSDHIDTINQIFQISEKMDEPIPDELPDEIIERPNQDVLKESNIVTSEKSAEEIVKGPEEAEKSTGDNKIDESREIVVDESKSEKKVVIEERGNLTKEMKGIKEIKPRRKGVRKTRWDVRVIKEDKVKSKEIVKPKEVDEEPKEIDEKPKEVEEKPKEVEEKPKENKEKTEEIDHKSKETKEKVKEIDEKSKKVAEKMEENKEKIIESKENIKDKQEIKIDLKTEIQEEKIKTINENVPKDVDETADTETIDAKIGKPEETPDKLTSEVVEKSKEIESDQPPETANIAVENQAIHKEDEGVTEESLENIKNEAQKDSPLSLEVIGKNTNDLVKSMFQEDEMVNIEGNLTVVTESDLADKQVEIATTPEISKPITLASFSMDFCDDADSYVKAESIVQDFPKVKSTSPIILEEKKSLKEDGHKRVEEVETPKMEVIPPEERMRELYAEESRGRKRKTEKDKLALDLQNVDSTRIIENKGAKMKKFENVITPAKEVPPSVIMEGFDELLKEDVTDDSSTIDESKAKEQIIPEKGAKQMENVIVEAVETIPIEESKEDAFKAQISQDIIKDISQKEEIIIPPMDISVESEVAKITDSIAEQEMIIQDNHHSSNTSSTKLLEILTDKPKSNSAKSSPILTTIPHIDEPHIPSSKAYSKHTKFIPKRSTPGPSKTLKATILSDKLIKPLDESKTVSVKKVTSKRTFQDVEDIDTYIIQKPVKKLNLSAEPEQSGPNVIKKTPVISRGKARILQQTIITPTGDILQPPVTQPSSDDNMFDINSMPIVLSDQILTPEGIENMQIVLQETPVATSKAQINPIKKTLVTPQQQQQVKLLNKTQSPIGIGLKDTVLKTPSQKTSPAAILSKHKAQKIYPTATTTPTTTKIVKHSPSVIAQPGKQGKFIIVPATTTATGSKYTVGKRPAIVKKPPQKVMTPISKIPDAIPMTSSGNKIMILKGQGQQQKIVLTTPQKQLPPAKIKGRTIGQKQIISKDTTPQKGANIISQTIVNSKGQITTVASQSPIGNRGHQIVAAMAQQNRGIKLDPTKMKRVQGQRFGLTGEITKPGTSGQQRTIIIKNPQGQTVKKIQGTDDALLDQQVAEQLQAISRASASQHLKDLASSRTKLPAKKPYIKRPEPVKQIVTKTVLQNTQIGAKNVSVPPLAPISPTKKAEAHYGESSDSSATEGKTDEPKRPPHQLVIQDAQGNQTTITEGQILALPSEAIDGQPHSYVLVTLDETGNLAPLNSEALMSLDPNLNLTSDLGNMVLQIDQGATTEPEPQIPEPPPQRTVPEPVKTPARKEHVKVKETIEKPAAQNVLIPETPPSESGDQNVQAVINSGEMGQLIITGDAATAQKFLESLAEGNADLANLLANAEGNVLIQADGQQILINTDSENPMLVMNPESISNESSEGSGNPIFAGQPVKNQDILAAALADTDVFQQDQSTSHSPSKVAQSQLSPNNALYPINVTNVLETNSMNSPIMTPLEVPSTNTKKIDDGNEILNQIPKNVDLPITITDPTIAQTVAQQQVASLIASELRANLDLPLAIQDPGLSVTSAEMSSPSFVYSLPTLDDTVDITQKAFSGSISMPLLTEEPEDPITDTSNSGASANVKEAKSGETDKKDSEEKIHKVDKEESDPKKSDLEDDKKTDFLRSGGLCGMRRICSSLSEPPPDMFEFTDEYESSQFKSDIPMVSPPSSESGTTLNDGENSVGERKNEDSGALYTASATSPSTNTDDSCEIPVQPPIIAKPFDKNGTSESPLGNQDKMTPDGDV